MKVQKESIDSYFVQRYADVVESKGFGCRIEQGTDSDSFFVSINRRLFSYSIRFFIFYVSYSFCFPHPQKICQAAPEFSSVLW